MFLGEDAPPVFIASCDTLCARCVFRETGARGTIAAKRRVGGRPARPELRRHAACKSAFAKYLLELQPHQRLLWGGADDHLAESTRSVQDTVARCLPIGALMAGH